MTTVKTIRKTIRINLARRRNRINVDFMKAQKLIDFAGIDEDAEDGLNIFRKTRIGKRWGINRFAMARTAMETTQVDIRDRINATMNEAQALVMKSEEMGGDRDSLFMAAFLIESVLEMSKSRAARRAIERGKMLGCPTEEQMLQTLDILGERIFGGEN